MKDDTECDEEENGEEENDEEENDDNDGTVGAIEIGGQFNSGSTFIFKIVGIVTCASFAGNVFSGDIGSVFIIGWRTGGGVIS